MSANKVEKLSVFLLKKIVKNYEDCFKSGKAPYKSYEIDKDLGIEGRIYIGNNNPNSVDWVNFLQKGVTSGEKLPEQQTKSARAVIIIKRSNRFWALTFGYGRYLLNEDHFVKDFGLKVVLNGVNPQKITTMDVTKLSDLNVHTKMQASRLSSKESFGFDIVNNLMRAVAGEPNDKQLGSFIAGREQVNLSPKIDFVDLGRIIDTLFKTFNSKKYKANFQWIDDVSVEKDPDIIRQLNEKLESAMTVGDDSIVLAPPEPIDWEYVSGFTFSPKGELRVSLAIEDFYKSLNKGQSITLSYLKSKKIFINERQTGEILSKWSIYRCLNTDYEINNHKYSLIDGDWYKIEKKLSQTTSDYIKTIPASSITFPHCSLSENEKDYNERVSNSLSGFVLLDRKNIYCEMARTPIEACDLLSINKELIHVKFKYSSSTLSHLFSQGRVSAEALARDEKFREELRNVILQSKASFVSLIPQKRISNSSYKIVFAIIDKSSKPLHQSLPFFSLLNLKQTAEYLRMMQYEVEIAQIKHV